MRAELMRTEVQRALRRAPFRPFILSLENGERAIIEHPENIAFDPRPGGAIDFYVLTGSLRLYSSFDAVSGVAMLSNGKETGSEEQVQA